MSLLLLLTLNTTANAAPPTTVATSLRRVLEYGEELDSMSRSVTVTMGAASVTTEITVRAWGLDVTGCGDYVESGALFFSSPGVVSAIVTIIKVPSTRGGMSVLAASDVDLDGIVDDVPFDDSSSVDRASRQRFYDEVMTCIAIAPPPTEPQVDIAPPSWQVPRTTVIPTWQKYELPPELDIN